MSTATVLLISAQPADQARLAEALAAIRGQPYRLEVVSSLAEALSRIKHGRVDAILLDLTLPDSDGLTTFLRLQPKATHVPIVVLVGPGEEEVGAEAIARGALDFLQRDHLSATAGRTRAAVRDRAHAHDAGPEGVGAALSRTVPERDGRRVPDDRGRQVHGGEPGARAHARLRLRGRAARARRRPRHLHGPGASRQLDQDDEGDRRSPQRRTRAEAQGRLARSSCWRIPVQCAMPTAACCSTKAP